MKVGFIGLGSMGAPMAQNIIKAGHELTVYNRTLSRAESLGKAGARIADEPSEAANEAELLVTMLADDRAVEAVLLGEIWPLGSLPRGAVHVSMSTISPELSRHLGELHAAAGQGYVAAPVFGRPEMAEAGKLWIVAAGPSEEIRRCAPVFEAVGQGVLEVGEDVAASSVVKVAGNFLLASAIEAMGEAFAMLRKHGIDPVRFLDIVNGHVFRSPVYQAYGSMIARGEYEPAGFKLALGLKDTRLVLEAADEVSVPMPLASLIRDHFMSGVARGWSEIDWAALGRISAANAGLGT
jgi:3-hydroxyisobutyrate dehydrogenase-like beta-hydroxyacid dehydrogenase